VTNGKSLKGVSYRLIGVTTFPAADRASIFIPEYFDVLM
jgi:hypothetical protein